MATQFKFGDMVEYERFGTCVITEVTEHFLTITNKHGHFNAIADPAKAKLIPHPDTARLDWLEKQMLEDNPQQIVFDGFAFTTMEDKKQCKSGDHTSLRDAIDDNMKQGTPK